MLSVIHKKVLLVLLYWEVFNWWYFE